MAYMRKRVVGRNDIVPIIAIRSWHVIASILGVLKAGGAYMPIDSYYHKDKIEGMIDRSCPKQNSPFIWSRAEMSGTNCRLILSMQ